MSNLLSLKKNYEFKKTFNKGKNIVNRLLVIYFIKNIYDENRLGIVVNKKIGNAVTRNRVKRLIKESYRGFEGNIKKGFDIVIVSRVKASDASFKDIDEALRKLIKKSGLFFDSSILEKSNNEKNN